MPSQEEFIDTAAPPTMLPVSSPLQETLPSDARIKTWFPWAFLHKFLSIEYQESKQSKIKITALKERGKIRGLTTLAYCMQDRLGCSWCMGNSLWPLEALASAA